MPYSESDKQKETLIEAYVKLGCAQADVLLESEETQAEEGHKKLSVTEGDLQETYEKLQNWADMGSDKVTNHRTLIPEIT